MRNVAHFFFSYNGIFGIEEVILQNIWQNTQEKIRNIKRAVSYTHLTLPTKRIV